MQAGSAALASAVPGEGREGPGAPGELLFLTAAHGRGQEGIFFRRHRKGNFFYYYKDDNLRHCLYCLASEQAVELGVSEVLSVLYVLQHRPSIHTPWEMP